MNRTYPSDKGPWPTNSRSGPQESEERERDKESIEVLKECIELQIRKSQDYQNPLSTVKQADYYPRGIQTLFDSIWGKLLRTKSLIEAYEHGVDAPNFESIEDSFKDLINYSSFAVSYCRHRMEGQSQERDILNRPYNFDGVKDNE